MKKNDKIMTVVFKDRYNETDNLEKVLARPECKELGKIETLRRYNRCMANIAQFTSKLVLDRANKLWVEYDASQPEHRVIVYTATEGEA